MDYSYYPGTTQQSSYPFINSIPHTSAETFASHDDGLTHDQPEEYHDPSYQTYNNFQRYEINPFASAQSQIPHNPQQPPPPTQHSPPHLQHRPSVNSHQHSDTSMTGNGSYSTGLNGHPKIEQNGNESSSEEKDNLTPAQSRRKAQNRAAQRAFRERKERHVKELELKLNELEEHSHSLSTDNERLKSELAKLATQHEILKATTSAHRSNYNHRGASSPTQIPLPPPRQASPVHGPQTYSPLDFTATVGIDPKQHGVSNIVYKERETGEKLLAAGATWEYIQHSEPFRKGQVDVEDVIKRLKGRAACDGQGPAFRESEIKKAIENSIRAAGDELI